MRMITALTLATALSALAACTKKDEAAAGAAKATPAENGGATAAPGTPGAKTDWAKVERVPFAKLQTVLPDSVLTLKRNNLGGETVPNDEYTHSKAIGEYEGPGEKTLSITIEDNPAKARDVLGQKMPAWKGHPVTSESESSDHAEVTIVVGERFFVAGNAGKLKAADIKSAFEKIDLAKLASWKNEGVKK